MLVSKSMALDTSNHITTATESQEIVPEQILMEIAFDLDGEISSEEEGQKDKKKENSTIDMFDFDFDFDDKTPSLIDNIYSDYISLKVVVYYTLTLSLFIYTHFSPPDFS